VILPRHPSGDQDDDPTGVRALLSALPEPEPMPDDLVHRITASLAAEQASRGPGDGVVVPLHAHRRPGRRVLTAVAVAAGIAAVGLAGTQLLPLGQQASSTSGAASSAGAQLAASPDAGRKAAPGWSRAACTSSSPAPATPARGSRDRRRSWRTGPPMVSPRSPVRPRAAARSPRRSDWPTASPPSGSTRPPTSPPTSPSSMASPPWCWSRPAALSAPRMPCSAPAAPARPGSCTRPRPCRDGDMRLP
jgi:hypothetical protein